MINVLLDKLSDRERNIIDSVLATSSRKGSIDGLVHFTWSIACNMVDESASEAYRKALAFIVMKNLLAIDQAIEPGVSVVEEREWPGLQSVYCSVVEESFDGADRDF